MRKFLIILSLNSFVCLQMAHSAYNSRFQRSKSEPNLYQLRKKSNTTCQFDEESIRSLASIVGHAGSIAGHESRYFVRKHTQEKVPSLYSCISNWFAGKTGYKPIKNH